MKVFKTKENGNIYINEDDFQVATAMQLGYKMMMDAYDEADKRGMIKAVMAISPLQRDLIQAHIKDEKYEKIGRLIYDSFWRILPKCEEI